MNCEYCNNQIEDQNISAAGKSFCSNLCWLKFYKEEMPNLGGSAITNYDIEKVSKSEGEEGAKIIEDIFKRTQESFDSSDFMNRICREAENDN